MPKQYHDWGIFRSKPKDYFYKKPSLDYAFSIFLYTITANLIFVNQELVGLKEGFQNIKSWK